MFDRANMGSIYTFVTDDTLLIFNKVWEFIEKDKQQLIRNDAEILEFYMYLRYKICRPRVSCRACLRNWRY